jgi:rootletin
MFYPQVEREKLKSDEFLSKTAVERTGLDRSLSRLEEENIELQRAVQALQGQLASAEQEHSGRLIDLTTRHRQETELETERLRSAQLQAEKMLEARERAHRQRVKGLEEQV